MGLLRLGPGWAWLGLPALPFHHGHHGAFPFRVPGRVAEPNRCGWGGGGWRWAGVGVGGWMEGFTIHTTGHDRGR